MPYRVSTCWCDGKEHRVTAEVSCPGCGGPGKDPQWHLTMYEAMARFQYVTGLQPLGKHREFTDAVLDALRDRCPSCAGEGVVALRVDDWRLCPSCEGTGGFWIVPEARIREGLERILKRFPGVGAPPLPGFVSYPLVYDLDAGAMVAV